MDKVNEEQIKLKKYVQDKYQGNLSDYGHNVKEDLYMIMYYKNGQCYIVNITSETYNEITK